MKKSELRKIIRKEISFLNEILISEKDVKPGDKVCYGFGRAIKGNLKLKYDKVKYVLGNQVKLQGGKTLYLSDGSFVFKKDMINKHLEGCIIR